MAKTLSDGERAEAAEIVAWFSALIHGWRTGDLAAAGEAQKELDQRGVTVRIPRRRPAAKSQKGGDDQ